MNPPTPSVEPAMVNAIDHMREACSFMSYVFRSDAPEEAKERTRQLQALLTDDANALVALLKERDTMREALRLIQRTAHEADIFTLRTGGRSGGLPFIEDTARAALTPEKPMTPRDECPTCGLTTRAIPRGPLTDGSILGCSDPWHAALTRGNPAPPPTPRTTPENPSEGHGDTEAANWTVEGQWSLNDPQLHTHIWADRLVGALDDLAAERASLAALLKERDAFNGLKIEFDDIEVHRDRHGYGPDFVTLYLSGSKDERETYVATLVNALSLPLAPPTPRTKGEGE